MSNQFRSRSSRYSRSKGSNPKHQDRKSNSGRNTNQSQSMLLDKLHKDYKPTFKLHFKWEPEEYYKIKMPHPHIPNEKETVQLPILSESSTELGDRAVFYNAIVDIQDISTLPLSIWLITFLKGVTSVFVDAKEGGSWGMDGGIVEVTIGCEDRIDAVYEYETKMK